MHVRSEHYEGIGVRDLHRFHADLLRAKRDVSRMPEKSNGWQSAAWAIAGIAATTGTIVIAGVAAVVILPLAVASLALLAITTLCGVFHRKFNEQTQEE